MKYQIGFLGAGNMAYALCSGFVDSKLVDSDKILVSSKTGRTFPKFEELGVKTSLNNDHVLSDCDIVFLAVKPHILKPAINSAGRFEPKGRTFVSVAAGVDISTISKTIGEKTESYDFHVLRVMPNTPSLVKLGAMGVSGDSKDMDFVLQLLSSVGEVEIVEEHLINAICGMAGSGPAFVYTMIEAMSDAGVKQGLPRAIATKFAAQTFLGAAEMVKSSGKHTGELKDQVTSPGGTTIAGVHELERGGVRSAIMDAVEAATKRAHELSKQ